MGGGDLRTALKVLDGLGLLRPPTIRPENVEALELQRKQEENAQSEAAFFAELQAVIK